MSLINDLIIMGSGLNQSVRDSMASASISADLQAVTQLDFTLYDKRWAMLETGLFKLNMSVQLGNFNLEIASIATGDQGGLETVAIKCRPKAVRLLKARQGTRVLRNSSPTDFVVSECQALGIPVLAQSSAKRSTVARDVPQKGESPEITNPPSSWTTFSRLATELGYVMFEACGVIHFGKPSWLLQDAGLGNVAANYITGDEDDSRTVLVPKCTRTEDDPATTVAVGLIVGSVDYARPGKSLTLAGVPTFNGQYLITEFQADLLITPNVVSITAGTPLNPSPEPPTTGSTTNTTRLGTSLAADFVYWVQKQVGD